MKYLHFNKVTLEVFRGFDTDFLACQLPPNDEVVEATDETWAQYHSGARLAVVAGVVVPWEQSPGGQEQILASLTQALQSHLDTEAQTKRYDNIKSAALRAGYPGPFHDEGVAAATWMDTCFALGYTILAEVQAQTRPMPTEAELIALLPPMVWP